MDPLCKAVQELVCLFVSPHGYTIPKSYKLLFPCTNNIAEYEALTNGLKMAIEWRITKLHIYGDSQLIINQVNDDCLTKNVKRKDIFEVGNLFEVPEDEVLDHLPSYFQDRSLVLIEPTQAVNLGTNEALTNGLKMAIEWRITELHIYGDS